MREQIELTHFLDNPNYKNLSDYGKVGKPNRRNTQETMKPPLASTTFLPLHELKMKNRRQRLNTLQGEELFKL